MGGGGCFVDVDRPSRINERLRSFPFRRVFCHFQILDRRRNVLKNQSFGRELE
jgi:hypothetical protein